MKHIPLLLAVAVSLVGLSAAVASNTSGSDVVRLANARLVDGEYHVAVQVINDRELAGMDIPLRFGNPGDPITLDRVEFGARVAGWDFTHAAIDNENKTVILGFISELTNIRPDADLKVSPSAENSSVADLVFKVPDGYKAEFSTFTTKRPTHELSFIYNRYEAGVPYVESIAPTFESDVDFKAIAPTSFALSQNYPNPFNPSTSFALDLPVASDYSIHIYNVAGQLVKSFDGHAAAGTVTITWDGTSNQGSKVASGVYFYRAEAQSFSASRRMLLLK